MRKLIFSILLASAAASPALAQDHGRWQNESEQSPKAEAREQAREQRQEQRQEQRSEAREQRFNGGGNFDRGQQQQQPQIEARRQQWQGNSGAGQQDQAQQQWQRRGGFDGHRRDDAQQQVVQQQQQQQQQQQWQGRNNWNGGDRRNWTGSQTQQTQTNGGWSRDRGSWSHDRDGDLRQRQVDQQARDSSRWAPSGQRWSGQRYSGNWDRNWRNNSRYDWRRYRDRNRSIFHIGVYFDPFGYSYRPYNIGYQMYGAYLGQQYWIDPALYGLPYPPPGTQWVRYWNDAVLVDMYTGEVIDVIRDFFW